MITSSKDIHNPTLSSQPQCHEDSQFQRIKRSVVRLTRRYHKQERFERRGGSVQVNGNGQSYNHYNFPKQGICKLC